MSFNTSSEGVTSVPEAPVASHIMPMWLLSFFVVLSSVWLKSILIPYGNAAVKAPIVGLRWAYLARIRYLTNAMELLQEGYHKVCYLFKGELF